MNEVPTVPPFDPNEVGAIGFYFLFVFLLLLPWAAIRSGKRLATLDPLPTKSRFLASSIFVQIFLAAFALWTARNEWIELFPPVVPRAIDVAAGLAFLAVAILCMRPRWKRAVERGDRRLHLFTPMTLVERGLWIVISLCAGIGEELSYRGVLTTLVERLSGSLPLAILVAAVAFGVAHAVQGRRGAIATFVFALGFHGLAVLTGALYVGMAVHFAYDVIAGLTYGRYARERAEAGGAVLAESP